MTRFLKWDGSGNDLFRELEGKADGDKSFELYINEYFVERVVNLPDNASERVMKPLQEAPTLHVDLHDRATDVSGLDVDA